LQYKIFSKSLFIVWNVRFCGRRNNTNFTEIRLHKICRAPFMYTISISLQK
jgi:hypothetical protein